MAGSLRQRGERSWELRVHAGRDETTGKKRYVTRTVRGGRREAERARAKLVTEAEAGTVTPISGTVGELCERWLQTAAPSLSPSVVPEYRRILDKRILPELGATPLRKLRAADLDAWYRRLLDHGGANGEPLAPNTVRRVHAVLRRALNQGVRWGWIGANPATAATPPRARPATMAVPSAATVGRLIDSSAAVNPGLPVFLRLAAVTGARRGELCALRWRHLDLEHGVMHVERSLVEVGGQLIEKGTKTHAERRLTLDAKTIQVLTAHRDALEHLLNAAGGSVSAEAFVFSHLPDGTEPWRPNYVTLAFGRLVRQHGIAGLRLHDLRHFAATTMLTKGIDVRTAAGRLGHASTSTTLDVYSHFLEAADERAATTMASALDS